jgi:hypothetical protein
MKKLLLSAGIVFAMIACKEQSLSPTEDVNNHSNAKAGTQTGQGIMANLYVQSGYVITEAWVYQYDKDAAKAYYTGTTVTGPVITKTGTGAQPAAPAQPAILPIGSDELNAQKCIFYNGGQIGYTYTRKASQPRGWEFTWTYTVTGPVVAPETAWTKTVNGGEPVSAPINAQIAGLSVMSSTQHPSKASFSLLSDDGLSSRITDLKVTVDGTEFPATSELISGTDFLYNTNAGSNGITSLLTPYENRLASEILLGDSFSGNNAISNAVSATMGTITATLGEGEHTVTLTGLVKGNAASASAPISITKKITISGQCNNN